MMRILKRMLLCIAFASVAYGQCVFIGEPPKDWCYKAEIIQPNLVLSESVHVSGRIFIAGTGLMPGEAPLNNSRVELRRYISKRKQIAVKVVTTDGKGYFDLGPVGAGKYRLLASPNRQFQQPADLKCSGDKCELDIGVTMNPTDQCLDACPIR
jgi:hypothetical protein